jgi:cytochrome bd ubiquinol oxidase subunit I
MHTPAGHSTNAAGRFVPESWFDIIFNPSFPDRLVHMVLAAYLTTAFAVGAAGAFHLLRDNRDVASRTMFSMAMWMAALLTPSSCQPCTRR